MTDSLKIVEEATGLLALEDVQALRAMAPELRQVFDTVQCFRTRTEMLVSVLNDAVRPTPDAKYWQAVREMDVFLGELVELSYQYRKAVIGVKRLRRALDEEEDELSREDLVVDIEREEWRLIQMERAAKHRARELREWSAIKRDLAPDLEYGADDVNAHQLKALTLRYELESRLLTPSTPIAERRNVVGLTETARKQGRT